MKITDILPWRNTRRELASQAAPADPMLALQRDVDRAFENFWAMVPYPFSSNGQLETPGTIRLDVEDKGSEITVSAELPGMTEADVDVVISDGRLTIRGEKKSDREAVENGLLIRERVYGVMERTVPLPDGIDMNAANASFKNGVLTIAIPKSAEFQANARRIAVQAG
jgi:HSP20 family protein